jgi:hypothetical protein
MVQSEFNLIFWFVSYNIIFIVEQVGLTLVRALFPALSHVHFVGSSSHQIAELHYVTLGIAERAGKRRIA